MSRAACALLGLVAVMLAGCADGRSQVGRILPQEATQQQLPVCHGYGCKMRTMVALSDDEWATVAELFVTGFENAAAERDQIAVAVGRIERLVGPKAGTAKDKGENSLSLASAGELDCVDEAANTTTYLRLLAANGLLRWHEVASRRGRARGQRALCDRLLVLRQRPACRGRAAAAMARRLAAQGRRRAARRHAGGRRRGERRPAAAIAIAAAAGYL
jgi:hypothetical protein